MRSDNCKFDGPPSRLAIYLSALVWPGVGQYAQKRWLAGTFYAVLFLVCVIFLFTAILTPLFWNLRLAMEFAGTRKPVVFHPIPFLKIFFWLGLSLAIYFAGMLDTFICYKRKRRQD